MKKMLMLASVASMIDQFNMPNIEILRKMGYEVHVAANFKYGSTSSRERVEEFKEELDALGIPYYHIDFSRKITDVARNINAFKQIKNLMLKNKYEFIHCHSPIGGVCGRLAAHRTNIRVIYTAHGFHFFNGAPKKNWIFYYPVERFLARYTDVLITINKEDYKRSQKFKAKRVEYVSGVGVNTKKFEVHMDRTSERSELGIREGTTILLSIGELSKRKNHEVVIKALAKLKNLDIIYLICGRGDLEQYLESLVKNLGIEDKVKFLGFRKDIVDICSTANIFVFPSLQEGLPAALMEAMAAGLPIVCSDIRGNTDLIEEGKGGYLLECQDVNGFADRMLKLYENRELCEEMSKTNLKTIKSFSIENVNNYMKAIYEKVII